MEMPCTKTGRLEEAEAVSVCVRGVCVHVHMFRGSLGVEFYTVQVELPMEQPTEMPGGQRKRSSGSL